MKDIRFPRWDIRTVFALGVGGFGAGLAYLLHFPVYPLTGPALLVSLACMAGLSLAVSDLVRNGAFVILGIGIGSGVDERVTEAIARWPLAFLVLALLLFVAMFACRAALMRGFGFDHKSAVLASAPGHLSFVISLGSSVDVDITRVAVVQSVRLLALTLMVPLLAIAFGVHMDQPIVPVGAHLTPINLVVLLVLALGVGWLFERWKVPAALLLGAMLTSSIGHLTGWTPGTLSPYLMLPCLVVVGTAIGGRFSGVDLRMLGRCLGAGLVAMSIVVGLASAFAIPVAWFLEMPVSHVLVAFAPGGLETMIAMGTVLGANPGFVAACHVGRLLMLSFIIPLFLFRKIPEPGRPT